MIRINRQKFVLAVPYIIFPLVSIFTRIVGIDSSVTRNWIDLFWLLLLFISLMTLIINRGKNTLLNNQSVLFFTSLSLLFIGVIFFKYVFSYFKFSISYVPYFMEAKPFFYIFCASLWVIVFGHPKNEDFVEVGVWLGAILITEFIAESLIAGRIVRILGSGEINYDAFLLLISICASLEKPDRNPFHQGVLYAGILSTLSRTALGTAVLIILIFGRSGILTKIFFSGVSIVAIILSFIVRDIPIRIVSADRYWMWKVAIDMFRENPWKAVKGFPIGVGLPVKTPPALYYLWELQQRSWGLDGIFQFNFHAFWLRIAISWGVLITLVIILTLIIFIIVPFNNSRDLRGLAMLCLIGGLTMGLFYLSNVGVPLIFAFWGFSSQHLSA